MRDLFVNEDLSKAENRINLAIFGLMPVRPFREWFQSRLGLPVDAVLYPPTNIANDAGAGRPDFVVKAADSDTALAWIDVECGRDEEQIARFRRMLAEPVYAVWGSPGPGCDLSLREIAQFLETCHVGAMQMQRRSFVPERQPVSREMRAHPFVVALEAGLGGRLSYETGGKVWAGAIHADTVAPQGFSLRVNADLSQKKESLSVLNITQGRPKVYFSSQAKFREYLPSKFADIERLRGLIIEMGGLDIAALGYLNKAWVSVKMATRRAPDLARLVLRLAETTH